MALPSGLRRRACCLRVRAPSDMRLSGGQDRERSAHVYGLNPLRRARQARGLTLQNVAAVTKLSPRVLNKNRAG